MHVSIVIAPNMVYNINMLENIKYKSQGGVIMNLLHDLLILLGGFAIRWVIEITR